MIRNTYQRSLDRFDNYHRRSSMYVSHRHKSAGDSDVAKILQEVRSVHHSPGKVEVHSEQFEEMFVIPPKQPTPSITKRPNPVLPQLRRRVAL